MSTTATPTSVLDASGGELVLRVCGSSRDGQIVRLKSNKCTIGSGPRSTLRLRARGVRPVHCLIVRGSQNTVIRRWSPDTRLNGRDFVDAELVNGDRLGIGMIELEVLDPGRLCPSNPVETQQSPPYFPPSLPNPSPSQRDSHNLDRLAARLTLANRQGRQRVRRLLERLRSANREIEQFRQTRQQGQQPRPDQAAVEPQQQDLERCSRHWDDERPAATLPPRKWEPVDTERSQPSDPTQAASREPIDIAEVFRRMHARGLSSEGQEPAAGGGPQHSAPLPESQPPNAPRSANAAPEESIEQYMARLLDRLDAAKGHAQRQEHQRCGPQPEPPDDPVRQDRAQCLPPERPAVPRSVTPPRQPEKMEPRALAPERHVDLSAMRELANLSAHSAIDRYARRRVKAAAWGKVLTTAVGLGAGAILLWIWWTNQTSELTFYAALVSLLVALLWGLQCVRLAGGEMPHRSQDPVGQSGEDRNEAGADAAAQDAEARGQYALPGDEAGPPIDDSEQTWEQELESLVEAWPRPDST